MGRRRCAGSTTEGPFSSLCERVAIVLYIVGKAASRREWTTALRFDMSLGTGTKTKTDDVANLVVSRLLQQFVRWPFPARATPYIDSVGAGEGAAVRTKLSISPFGIPTATGIGRRRGILLSDTKYRESPCLPRLAHCLFMEIITNQSDTYLSLDRCTWQERHRRYPWQPYIRIPGQKEELLLELCALKSDELHVNIF